MTEKKQTEEYNIKINPLKVLNAGLKMLPKLMPLAMEIAKDLEQAMTVDKKPTPKKKQKTKK